MKTIMILGAAEGQLPFLNICKNKGYRTIVVSVPGDYPGFKLADKAYYCDTRDKEQILQIARDEHIDAITTDQTDVSVMSVAYVAEKLGLRGIGCDNALKFTNKYEMRKAAREAGICVPDFKKITSIEDAEAAVSEMGYPVIIKPVDSSGSRGVFKINNIEELRENYPISASKSLIGDVIMEQFIVGKEYLADGFAMDNEYHTLDVGEKEFFDVPNIFVSRMCMFSSANKLTTRQENMVKETNDKLIRAFGLPFGITHAEYIYSPEKDAVYLVECAARGGGVFLSSDLTPMASGFNTNEALIDYIVEGNVKKVCPDELEKKVSAWVCFSFPEGKIKTISKVDETKAIPGVEKVIMSSVYEGMETHPLRDDSGKYGPILVVEESKEACYSVIEKVRDTLCIDVETSEGLKGLIW